MRQFNYGQICFRCSAAEVQSLHVWTFIVRVGEQLDESLKRWSYALEKRGMNVTQTKSECVLTSEKETGVTVNMERVEVVKEDMQREKLHE